MTDSLKIKRTSHVTSEITDIVIRETKTTRIVVRPVVVENPNNHKDSVKCWIVAQRRGGPGEEWIDAKDLTISNLKKGEWTKIELKTSEVSELLRHLDAIRKQYEKLGIFFTGEYSLVRGKEAQLLSEMSKFDQDTLIKTFRKLEPQQLETLTETIKLSRLENIITTIKSSYKVTDESFWEKLLKDESWILSQVLSQPIIVIDKKPFLGGKGLENKGGKYSDIAIQNSLTRNTGIVEIKTPSTKLLGSKYRETYQSSGDLTGSINQLLTQKQYYLNNYIHLKEYSELEFTAVNPKCYLIIGTFASLKTKEEKEAFENFRNTLRDLEVITYDELYKKMVVLRDLLKE